MAEYNSDFNPAMAASAMFDSIINQVRSSNLNFQMQMTPFSATIVIKKTLIKDTSGFHVIPSTYKNHEEEMAEQKYKKVFTEIKPPKVSHTMVQTDFDEAITENKETLKKNDEKENDQKHQEPEVREKKLNKKLFKNLSKSHSNETKIKNDAESEVDATDDDVDFNYNVEVSNIFSPLQAPQEESKVLAIATLSRPPLADQQDPCTAPPAHSRAAPSSSSPRSPARTPAPSPLNLTHSLPDSDQSWDIATNGEFQKIQQELEKVKKILEEYQPSGSRGTCST